MSRPPFWFILQNPPPIYEDRNASVLRQQQQEPAPDRQLGLPLSHPASTIASSSSSSSAHAPPPRPLPRLLLHLPDPSKNKNYTEFLEAQVSTDLTLAPPDPFLIKKTLEDSDLVSRLTLPIEAMEKHVLPYWPVAIRDRLRLGKFVVALTLWDIDEEREHAINLKMIQHSNSYVLNDKWVPEIVRDRKLEKGDQIGLCWDGFDSRFVFSVLQRHQVH